MTVSVEESESAVRATATAGSAPLASYAIGRLARVIARDLEPGFLELGVEHAAIQRTVAVGARRRLI